MGGEAAGVGRCDRGVSGRFSEVVFIPGAEVGCPYAIDTRQMYVPDILTTGVVHRLPRKQTSVPLPYFRPRTVQRAGYCRISLSLSMSLV